MFRTLVKLAALAAVAAAAVPASAYTPNPEDPYYPKKPWPCLNCMVKVKPGDHVINPGLNRRIVVKIPRINQLAR
jgi:hypothetical protein